MNRFGLNVSGSNKLEYMKFGDLPTFQMKRFGDLPTFYTKRFGDFFFLYNFATRKINIVMVFKRKIYNKMLKWKNEQNGKTALLIKGARRVGKSTIAEEFARKEYKSYIIIDFANISKEVNSWFDDMTDLDYLFIRLQQLKNVVLYERQSVLIFDEIQLQPLARQAIKYLVKDGRYDYIETGSLLTLKKNVKNIVIPSEETRLTLYPMDYEEFKWALGDEITIKFIKDNLIKLRPFGDAVHRKLMRDFRLYMLVGGMPQAVDTYLTTKNLSEVDAIKRNIIELYEDDFRKIDPTGRASKLYSAIPAQLTGNASRYNIAGVIGNTRQETAESVIADMEDSMTINMAYHANDPSIGMNLHRNVSKYKMFMSDTGLFVTLAFKDKDFTENIIYQKLLSDKLSADMGYVYENVVAQMLKASGNELFYYTFPSKTSNHLYEIDFLLSRQSKISPLEVKSSSYKRHVSLDIFSEKYSNRIDRRYLIYTKDIGKDGNTVFLPVYLVPFL